VTARNSDGERSDRVIVFTDAQLEFTADQHVQLFLSTMREYADRNIGATAFGVGFAFGHDVAFDISQIRGANYFFLSTYDRIVTVFDEEFDFLVTPVAYDVELVLDVPLGFDIENVYGIEAKEPFTHQLELKVPTLFLSTREGGGAIFVRARAGASLDRTVENIVANIDLSYETPEGEAVSITALTPRLPPEGIAGDGAYFESDAVRRGVLLMNTVKVLHDACDDVYVYDDEYYYWYYDYGAMDRAVSRLTDFLGYFDETSAGLDDCLTANTRCLSDERALVEKLRENIAQLYY
jgi:Ca-activated chloride channel family protein